MRRYVCCVAVTVVVLSACTKNDDATCSCRGSANSCSMRKAGHSRNVKRRCAVREWQNQARLEQAQDREQETLRVLEEQQRLEESIAAENKTLR